MGKVSSSVKRAMKLSKHLQKPNATLQLYRCPLSFPLFHSCCEAGCKAWPAPLLLAPATPACAAAGTASLGVASAAPDDAFGASVLTRLKGLRDMYTDR